MLGYNNPASRLHNLLSESHKHFVRGGKPLKAYDGWAATLGISPDNRAQVLKAIGEIGQLPKQISDEIRSKLPQKPDLYLSWVERASIALNQNNLDIAFRDMVTQVFTHDVMNYIEICADQLGTSHHAADRVQQKADDVKARLREARDAVASASDISAAAKHALEKALLKLESSLVDYRINGTPALLDAIGDFIGRTAVREAEFKVAKKSNAWRFVAAGVGAYFAFVGGVSDSLTLTDRMQLMLEDCDIESQAHNDEVAQTADAMSLDGRSIVDRAPAE